MPLIIGDTASGSDAIHPQHSQVEPLSLEAHRFVRLHGPLGTPKRPACDWPLVGSPLPHCRGCLSVDPFRTSGPHICSRKAPRHSLSAAKLWAIRMRRSTPPFDRCFGAASKKAKDEVRARDMGDISCVTRLLSCVAKHPDGICLMLTWREPRTLKCTGDDRRDIWRLR